MESADIDSGKTIDDNDNLTSFNHVRVGDLIYSYETSDGVSRTEEAEVKNAGTENEILVVRGTISWYAPDGQQYTITFIADENGFQPTGEHLPK